MGMTQGMALAASWHARLSAVDADVVVWREGPVSVALRRNTVHINAGNSIDFVLQTSEVGVCLDPGHIRLDWDVGSLDIDLPTAQALFAFGLHQVFEEPDADAAASAAA